LRPQLQQRVVTNLKRVAPLVAILQFRANKRPPVQTPGSGSSSWEAAPPTVNINAAAYDVPLVFQPLYTPPQGRYVTVYDNVTGVTTYESVTKSQWTNFEGFSKEMMVAGWVHLSRLNLSVAGRLEVIRGIPALLEKLHDVITIIDDYEEQVEHSFEDRENMFSFKWSIVWEIGHLIDVATD
jgi:hypothetical protein